MDVRAALRAAKAPTHCLRTLGYDLSFLRMGLASTSGSDEKHSVSSLRAWVRYCPFTLSARAFAIRATPYSLTMASL